MSNESKGWLKNLGKTLIVCILIGLAIQICFMQEGPGIVDSDDGSGIFASDPFTAVDTLTLGDNVGILSWENGVLEFEGNLTESAEILFDFLKPMIDGYIKSEMEKAKAEKPDEYYDPDWGTIEIGEQILYQFTTTGKWKESFKPEWFLKIVDTDLSRCFINGRLRVDLNGEIYWIRLER